MEVCSAVHYDLGEQISNLSYTYMAIKHNISKKEIVKKVVLWHLWDSTDDKLKKSKRLKMQKTLDIQLFLITEIEIEPVLDEL